MTFSPRMLEIGRMRDSLRRVPRPYRFLGIILVLVISVVSFGMSPLSAMIVVVQSKPCNAEFVCIADVDCGQCYRVAAERSKQHAIQGILLCTNESQRIVLMGAIPAFEELGRQKLVNDGVASTAIEILPGECRNDWDQGRRINRWLEENPNKRVCLLCDLFASRRWSLILDHTLTATTRPRVTIEGVTDPRYNETTWWRRRMGIKSYFNSIVQLVYARCHGEDVIPVVDWSPEKYESAALGSRQ